MWYSTRYRRHLCDMHISDWDEAFLAQFSPETYVENLKLARVNNAMIYLQSHAGLCYYPTETGVMHKALRGREATMRNLIHLCHQNDIKVTGYYSLQYNTLEHDRHPAWRMVEGNGKSRRDNGSDPDHAHDFAAIKAARYGLCCPNHPEYRQFVYAQTREMLSYFNLDALFLDMPFWPHTCYCAHCRARWEKEIGGEMPVNPPAGSEAHARLLARQYAWMGEWALALSAQIKSIRPDLPVEFNYAEGIAGSSDNGCGDAVNQASDYVGGDLYGGMLEHSFTCKFYKNATRNQPFEYMFSRCKPALRMHTLTKTLDEMKTSAAVTASHHGATLVIDALDPVGTMDRRVYERIGKMFDFILPYEPYFRGRMTEDIGIYYGIRSKFNAQGERYTSKTCAVTAAHTLMRAHLPFGVTGSFAPLDSYAALAAPMLSCLEAEDNDRLIAYVQAGGTLYLSGGGNRALVETLTGGKITGVTQTDKLYIAPTAPYQSLFGWFNPAYPLPFEGLAPILAPACEADVAATLTLPYTGRDESRFAAIHSDPPGIPTEIPMIIVKKCGKGTVIWSAVALEGVPMEEYRTIFRNLLLSACEKPFSLTSDAPPQVELTLFSDQNIRWVSAVSLCDEAVSPALPGFTVSVRTETPPAHVALLPGGREIKFTFQNGYTTFRARKLHIFDMYQITL